MINNPIIYKFFKDFTTTERRLTGWWFLPADLSPTFLNTETTNVTFQQSGKQDSFRHILKSLASMYESSGSQFFRTTTGIQSGPDTFEESKFIMVFLTILGVMEILFSFRLVLEGKTGKDIQEPSRLEFFKEFLANNFALSDEEDNTSGSLIRGVVADLPLLRALLAICQKSREPKFQGSDGLFCFRSICKFGSFMNPFATITSLLNFTVGTHNKSDFYQLWQQHKLLKTMEMSQV